MLAWGQPLGLSCQASDATNKPRRTNGSGATCATAATKFVAAGQPERLSLRGSVRDADLADAGASGLNALDFTRKAGRVHVHIGAI